MDSLQLMKCLENSHSIVPDEFIKQHWKKELYSYMSRPRPNYGFLLVIHGKIKISTKNNTLKAHSGDIIFLPKNCYYNAIFENETDNYLVNFDATNENFSVKKPFTLLNNTPISCKDLFSTLVEEQIKNNVSSFKLKSLFYLLMDNIGKCLLTQADFKNEVIEKAKKMLLEDEEIKISQIAQACNISESGLRKKFKDEVGISPAKYRLNFKLDKAKYMIESTDMSICEIANALHFYDSAYFCKSFKLYTGTSPKNFAKTKQL